MHSTQLPIACSLDVEDLQQRLAEMGRVGAAGRVDSQRAGRELTLRFRADDDVRGQLRAIVAAESRCCAFLEMELIDEERATMLEITAPVGAERVLDDVLAAFTRSGGHHEHERV